MSFSFFMLFILEHFKWSIFHFLFRLGTSGIDATTGHDPVAQASSFLLAVVKLGPGGVFHAIAATSSTLWLDPHPSVERQCSTGERYVTLPTTQSIWLKALCVGIGNPITLAMFFDILLASQLGCFIVGPFLPKSKAHFAQKVDPFCPKAVPFESFCCPGS